MEIRNAKIKSTSLGFVEHGLLSAWLNLEYSSSEGQGFGGYYLIGPAMAGFVTEVLKIVGVDRWEDLNGKCIRVKQDHNKVYEVGNLLEDMWFNPKKYMEKFKCDCNKKEA